ncbi:glutathione S-transferase [Sneathiella marina]|uniref:Glutathione S-transferase n=1 Tax=Sneathiella marina TaxID=2950108 RepID=A0ABY4W3R3_9PROT|nr:glutathione S-transferase [Sneathiella marina]USG61821.1 glutathione S-transferase [Sneathiella marina]
MTEPSLQNQITTLPVLYSFRRCPYAIRSRMTLVYSGITVELRDILLKDKPEDMIAASPKATVPVLKVSDGTVLDESFDIMLWALDQNDPDCWLPNEEKQRQAIFDLVTENDGPFKDNLDRYKYFVRHPDNPRETYRSQGEEFLRKLEDLLSRHRFLTSDKMTFADTAIFPFIRQFANSDKDWFDQSPYPKLKKWLGDQLNTDAFKYVMKKREIWTEGTLGLTFPENHGR